MGKSYEKIPVRGEMDMKKAEKEHIIKVLKIANYNITYASELLQISLATLRRKIKLYDIEMKHLYGRPRTLRKES